MNSSPSGCATSSKATHNTEVHASPHLSGWPLERLTFDAFLGLRPFGVSLLYAGWDPYYQFQLYLSDPSGNYSGWKATCIGANNGTAQSLLKQDYKEDIKVEDAIALVMKVMSKTMDSTTLGSEKRAFVIGSALPRLILSFPQSNLPLSR